MERTRDVLGVLCLSSIGYNWKIYRITNGKREQVAQSYYYTKDKQKALDELNKNYSIINGYLKDLFTI